MGVRIRLTTLMALIVGAAPVVLGGPPAAAATSQVVVRNFAFAATSDCNGPGGPVSTIQAGDTVLWRICEGGHTVTADDGRFDSGSTALTAGQTYSVPFPTPGTFNYYCRIHGSKGGVGMSGTVIVLGAPALTVPPTAPPTTRAVTPTTARPATTTTSRPPTTTTSRPPTTLPVTTTTAVIAPAVPTTEVGSDVGGGAVEASTTTTRRTERLEEAGADDTSDGGTDGWVVAALIVGILAVVGTAGWLWRRASTPTE